MKKKNKIHVPNFKPTVGNTVVNTLENMLEIYVALLLLNGDNKDENKQITRMLLSNDPELQLLGLGLYKNLRDEKNK